jgi:methionyl-tRNA formyltransferase
MKYIFFGSPAFAAIILEKLVKSNFLPTAVVCNPDKPVGRKKIITPPPTKILAEKMGIFVWQPFDLKIEDWEKFNKFKNIDFCIVAAYSKIIPNSILETMPNKFIGVHPSLLPKYRGTTPVQSVILNSEKETGVTLFLIDDKIDHGPILESRKQKIAADETYESLHNKLANLAADLLIETIPKFIENKYNLYPQNDKEATYTKKFTTADAYVDLEKDDPCLIERKIRALNPEPGVWTFQKKGKELKRMKILQAELKEGKLILKKIQFEGKKPQFI